MAEVEAAQQQAGKEQSQAKKSTAKETRALVVVEQQLEALFGEVETAKAWAAEAREAATLASERAKDVDVAVIVTAATASISARLDELDRKAEDALQRANRALYGVRGSRQRTRPRGRPPRVSAKTVRWLWRLRFEEGLTYREIAERATNRGLQTPSGGSIWTPQIVHGVLRSKRSRELASS
jgi:recombinase